MNINNYTQQFKQEVILKFETQKRALVKKRKLAVDINLLFYSNDFDFLKFINDYNFINEITSAIDLEELKTRFLNLTNKLQKLPANDLVLGNDSINNMKNQYLLLLNEISLYFSAAKAYSDISEFIKKIDCISSEFVVVDKYFIRFLERLGFNQEEILKFNGIVTKENINVCNKTIGTIKKSEESIKEKERKKQEEREKRKRNKNLLCNKISPETKRLLDDVSKLIEEGEFKFTDAMMKKALAYENVFIRDISFFPSEFYLIEDIDSCLFILIWEKFYEIDDKKDKNTEEELREEINTLNILYTNLISVTKTQVPYEDSMKDDYEKIDEGASIVYVIDDRNNNSYFLNAINQNKADSNFRKNADSIINKLRKGINKQKKPIDGIEDGYYVFQGLTYVSIIMLNEEKFIVLTASKWDNLFSESRNIYNNNIEQINDLRKQLVGDKYE